MNGIRTRSERATPQHRLRAWRSQQQGKWGYVLAWVLGVPIPILLVVYLLRGCT